MAYVITRNRVEDYPQWRRSFDEGEARRQSQGVRSARVFRSRDDPNEVLVLAEYDDLEEARRILESDQLRAALARGGVRERTVYYPEP